MDTTAHRAIGIIRVSVSDGRDVPGRDWSPTQQLDRIRAECKRAGLRLVGHHAEVDVSGGTPLDRREGLRQAVEAIENGQAEVIVAAYFDRLFRSLAVQAEVVDRVERAGGTVLAVDSGQVTNGTAAQWVSGASLGMMSEYMSRSAKERSGEAQARAVARGAWMSPYVPVGYTRVKGEPLEPTGDRHIVVDAFKARAAGATIEDVRELLRSRGIDLTYPRVVRLLKSRAYLGELHFGKLQNLTAHPAIVPADLWRAAQRTRPTPGRRANSQRLLARLDVLRCGSCGARMSATSGHSGTSPMYRCGSHVGDDCPRPVTIATGIIEGIVVAEVRRALADVEGRASVETNAREAERGLEGAQAKLEAAIRVFDGLDEQAAIERLSELRAVRDRAQERVDHLGRQSASVVINAADDWDRLSLDARRALIRATVDQVRVAPGRGPERITVKLVGE